MSLEDFSAASMDEKQLSLLGFYSVSTADQSLRESWLIRILLIEQLSKKNKNGDWHLDKCS